MPPGKKKSFNKKGNEDKLQFREKLNICKAESMNEKSAKPFPEKITKSNKNLERYEEISEDPHADKMHGVDFEVFSSCSGGIGSHLQLQEEKEWDDSSFNDKHIAIDFQHLALALKCIPFHKRLNLPEDLFDENQIEMFINNAEKAKLAYFAENPTDTISVPPQNLNILEENTIGLLESFEPSIIEENKAPKPPVIDEKTENLIESLASCLTLKNTKDKNNKSESISDTNESLKPETENTLDFLLSLNVPANKEKAKETKTTSVDDWLNSILDN